MPKVHPNSAFHSLSTLLFISNINDVLRFNKDSER